MGKKKGVLGYLPLLSLRVLLRRPGASLLLAAVAALGVYAGCGLHSLVIQQQRAIEETIQNTVIHGLFLVWTDCVIILGKGTFHYKPVAF